MFIRKGAVHRTNSRSRLIGSKPAFVTAYSVSWDKFINFLCFTALIYKKR